MTRFLVWKDEEEQKGWACSSCDWKFPLPSLLQDEDARQAYDRLGAAKFKAHTCTDRLQTMSSNWHAEAPPNEHPFAERARALVKAGYKPKDAVALILEEMALESRNDPKVMAQAKAEGERFLLNIREGRI